MTFKVRSHLFKLLGRIERAAAQAQGKGYYKVTIDREVKLLQSVLTRPPKLMIDIGGNIGDYTARLRLQSPNSEIIVFEPSATNIDKLKLRFKSDPLIKLAPFALSDSTGESTLYADEPGSGMGSLSKRRLTHFNITFESKEAIKTLRFEDYWIKNLQSRPIDLVKIDVEGHELAVLRGFSKALIATKAVQFEFGGTDIDTRTFFQDYWYLFKEAGFTIFRLTPFGLQQISSYSEHEECFAFTNFVAVNHREIHPN
jgi:FkbM family methyltransferase